MRYLVRTQRFHGRVHQVKFLLCFGYLLVAVPGATQTPADTFYVSVIGNDSNGGASPATAVRTLTKAMALAYVKGGGTVKVTQGHFDEPTIVLPANVVVEGNWDTGFAKQDVFTAQHLLAFKIDQDLCGTYTCITSSKADRVITIREPGAALKQLVVVGPNRASSVGSSSSYGVVVDGVNASLDHVVVKAGAGGVGDGGGGGQVGQGYCSQGGSGGWVANATDGPGANKYCTPHSGEQGDTLRLGTRVANGGAGGGPGNTGCYWNPTLNNVSDGGPGGTGDPGIEGSPGAAAAADTGAFTRVNDVLQWKSATADPRGGTGTAGGGGGGGGPGGSWNTYFFWCVWNDTLGLVLGGRGHDGNRGGCAGTGGGGGNSGGGAFALVINGGKVSVDNLVLFGGQGGNGGIGGNGNIGAVGEDNNSPGAGGGSASCGTATTSAATGGRGGAGGKGGGGGGGAGGNGGPAITLVKIGTGDVVLAQAGELGGVFRRDGGTAGEGGVGGRGADSQTSAPTGNKAAVAKEASFTAVPDAAGDLLSNLSATASSSTNDGPSNAIDGNPDTAWNAGRGAPSWIELDLQKMVSVRKMRLLVGQSPAGATTHLIYLGPNPAPTAQVASNSAVTNDGQWIEVVLPASGVQGRYLRVLTTSSTSWVAWREIHVFQ